MENLTDSIMRKWFGQEEEAPSVEPQAAPSEGLVPRPTQSKPVEKDTEASGYTPMGSWLDNMGEALQATYNYAFGTNKGITPDRSAVYDAAFEDYTFQGTGSASDFLPPVTTPVSEPAPTYTVASGDNLTRIAREYGVTVEALAEANSISNLNAIDVGQELTIPTVPTPTEESVEAEETPIVSGVLDSKRGEVAGPTTKAYNFLVNTGFEATNGQSISEKLAITGDQFTDREGALSFIEASIGSSPTRKAAFGATVEAESSAGLVEGTNYNLNSAIGMLGGNNADRISRIRRLYNGRDRLSAEDQVRLFDIAYGGRMGNAANEGYKYRGRGLIQITGKDNYRRYGEAIGVGDALVDNPDLILNNPSVMLAVTEAYLQDRLPDREDGLSANDLKDAIGHSGSVPDGITWNGTGSAYKGNQRWQDVIARLEEDGKQEEAEAARLNNEFSAQQRVGVYIDGDIGPASQRAMRRFLAENGIAIPEGTSSRELVRMVNEA